MARKRDAPPRMRARGTGLDAHGWCTLQPLVVIPGDVGGVLIVTDLPGAGCESSGGE